MIAQFLITFKDYLVEVLPFLAVGFLLSGLIHEFVPTGWVERHLGGKGVKPILYSTLIGTVLPIYCLGALPVAVSLHQKGARLGPVLAFLVANTSYLYYRSPGVLCSAWHKVHCLHILCRDSDKLEHRFCWEFAQGQAKSFPFSG